MTELREPHKVRERATGQPVAIKRTVFRAMNAVLTLNGVQLTYDTVETGQTIIRAAQGNLGEPDLAGWLRARSGTG